MSQLGFLEPDQLRLYSARPERLRELVYGSPDCKVIIIDEIQKVPAILTVVHALIEEKRGLQFILTGSSARKLKRTGVDLLAGRALIEHMPPFLARELGHFFPSPKLYLFDAGIFRSLRPIGPLDSASEIEGVALEGLVAQHLLAWTQAQRESHDLAFWRTRSHVEVDFVVYGPKGFWAFEVKNQAQVQPQDLKGLLAFAQDYPESLLFFLYLGKERLPIHNILCIPCDDFLKTIDPTRLLGEDFA